MKKLIGMVLMLLALNGCSHAINAKQYCAEHAFEYHDAYECYADVRASNARYQSQRAAAWSQASQNMSHSFNTYQQPVNCSSYAIGNSINTSCQ